MSWWKQYQVDIPEGESGMWKVGKFTVSAEDEKFGQMRSTFSFSSRGRFVPQGVYTGLRRNGLTIMSDTPDEIRDCLCPISRAQGHCLVNGMGLGVVVRAMLKKREVEKVTVIELSPEVIKLVAPIHQKEFGDRLEVIEADALTWKPPKGVRYGVVWNDIWDNLCADNLPEMSLLHRRYGRRCDWQGSWCRELLTSK